jgi:prepilin-type N-terminal cleavage/methylation domain-containing protein
MLTLSVTRRRRRAPRVRQRRGFTLVELMVAVIILAVGVLGLASTSTVVSRLMGGANQQTVAANVSATRFETLRSVQCTQIRAGSSYVRGVTERWGVQRMDGATWKVVDTLFWNGAGGQSHRQFFESYVRCN